MIPSTYIVFAILNIRWHTFCHVIRVMSIRIDFNSNGLTTIVRVSGRLYGSAAAQLKKACDPLENPVVIDLMNLLFADNEGINAIRSIADGGAQVRGASPFIQLLLDNAPGWQTVGEESNLHKWY